MSAGETSEHHKANKSRTAENSPGPNPGYGNSLRAENFGEGRARLRDLALKCSMMTRPLYDSSPDQDDAEAAKKPTQTIAAQSFEGDYRPSSEAPRVPGSARVEPLQTEFLLRLANTLNTTLDLQTLMHRTADLVRAVIDYKIFAILLLNERTNDLRMRFQIGHTPEAERLKSG